MEANMSGLKRRFNRAIVECRSQARFTARRLVGHIRPPQPAEPARVHLRHRALQESRARQFSYSFAPVQMDQQWHSSNLLEEEEDDDEDDSVTKKPADDRHYLKSDQTTSDSNSAIDEQQVEEAFLSEDTLSGSPSPVIIKSSPIRALAPIHSSRRMMSANLIAVNNKGSPQYAFVRCGSRRSSRRRRSARAGRQVRFQPIPQSIDISSHEESLEESVRPASSPEMPKFIVTSVKKYRRVHLSAKPLTKKLNQLSHVKFNKIKLKSFNNLAQQLHQSLSASSYAPSNLNLTKKVPNPASKSSPDNQQTTESKQDNHNEDNEDDDFGWGSDFDEQSLDSSLASQSDKPQTEHSSYLLEMGKSSCDFRAINDVIQDQGISGQFKRIDPSQSMAQPSRLEGASLGSSGSVPPSPPVRSDSIKQEQLKSKLISNADNKLRQKQCEQMIRDSLEIVEKSTDHLDSERGDSDRTDSENLIPVESRTTLDEQLHELGAVTNETDDDDEESLKSLEARQGFRQIRDKLKVILDQRLANYEASCSSNQAGAIAQQPHKAAETRPAQPESSARPAEKQSGLPEVQPPAEIHHAKTNSSREFDCHSHCSDESGSSSGLDSNHSGSQDSGHSTQHSGYSSHSCGRQRRHHHHHHRHLSPSIETDSPATCSPSSGQSESPSSPSCQKVAEPPIPSRLPASEQPTDPESNERRMRFAQNRLIINSKLESMFKSRHQVSPAKEAPVAAKFLSGDHLSKQTIQECGTSKPCSQVDNFPSDLDPETRRRMLEQQRQMSLKLKQKPRRKTAKRALMNPLAAGNVDSDQTAEENGSYASSSSELNRCNSMRRHRNGRDSLTKQLSMICLRQAGQIMRECAPAQQQQVLQSTSYTNGSCLVVCEPPTVAAAEQTLPRAAQSLRQLVKDVIDDCERPSKLSSLTMSILNRSDSLSSDLATSADEANTSVNDYSPPSNDTGRCSSSLNSLRAPEVTREAEGGCAFSGELYSGQLAPQPINYIYPMKQSSPQQVVDRSLSSVGSIDGLEYSRTSSGAAVDMEAANEQLQANLLPHHESRALKSTIGSYLKSLRDFSRHKLTKVKLMSNSGGVQEGLTAQRKQQQLDANDQRSLSHKLAPPESTVLFERELNGCSYNYEYQLDRRHQQPEGLSTLAGNWRRRPRRTSVMDAPMDSPSAKGDNFTNHFVTISNRKWKSCHLRPNLMQIAFNGGFAGHQAAPGGSPIRASKQHLAYLDNSKNFTDEDNY